MFDQIKSFVGSEVLEAGAGIGNLTELLLDRKRLVCVDNESFYVDRLRQSYGHLQNFKIDLADLTEYADLNRALDGQPVDTIVCLNVVEHIEDDGKVLKNFYENLKPGGRAIILVPHDPELYNGIDEVLGHYRRYSRKELCGKMEDAGFRVLQCKGFNRVGGFGWRVSGGWLGRRTVSPSQMRIFELGMPLIRIAEKFPFHSHNSVIAVGERPG